MKLFQFCQLLFKRSNLSQLAFNLLLEYTDLDHVFAADVVVVMNRSDPSRQVLMVVVRVRGGGAKHGWGPTPHQRDLGSHVVNL